MAQAHGLMPRDMVAGTQAVDPAEAAKFASLPLELEADELLVLVEGILARGVSVEIRVHRSLGAIGPPPGPALGRRRLRFRGRDDGPVALAGSDARSDLALPPPRAARPAHGPRCLPRCPATRTVSAR
ncbi:hypothetical protein ACFS32_25385 [Novosphingobium pokkalii]|uniref:hypothetical protein n=1 Tax=Novosphingobium pokkalii TaxID=1770194 RepID=UPI0036305608